LGQNDVQIVVQTDVEGDVAGAMRKMAVYLGLVEDAQVEDYDDYDDARRDVRTRDTRSSERRGYDDYPEDRPPTRNVRSVPESRAVRTFRSDDQPLERRPLAPAAADISRIETIHPRSYNDARRIGEEYREGVPVIMNLSELDDSDAKRIIDFAAGLVFGQRGAIERVTNKVFLLSPANVDVGEAAREQVAQDGFFNQS
jgi:cell division inhibitor SepF